MPEQVTFQENAYKEEYTKNYMQNAQGYLIPQHKVKPIDIERHCFVMDKIAKVKSMHEQLMKLKSELLLDMESFIAKSAEAYHAPIGGKKGNVTIASFDGKYQIKRQLLDKITFDERLHIAKSLINDCLKKWTQDSSDKVRVIVEHAFKLDKKGKLSISAILSLRKLHIEDYQWKQAMHAITDSVQIMETKSYIRIYEKTEDGQFKNISLEMSSL